MGTAQSLLLVLLIMSPHALCLKTHHFLRLVDFLVDPEPPGWPASCVGQSVGPTYLLVVLLPSVSSLALTCFDLIVAALT
jgi:hypothetical protein